MPKRNTRQQVGGPFVSVMTLQRTRSRNHNHDQENGLEIESRSCLCHRHKLIVLDVPKTSSCLFPTLPPHTQRTNWL